MEDFDIRDVVFMKFPNGAEVELSFLRARHGNPAGGSDAHILLHKTGILGGGAQAAIPPVLEDQREELRRIIYWIPYHDELDALMSARLRSLNERDWASTAEKL